MINLLKTSTVFIVVFAISNSALNAQDTTLNLSLDKSIEYALENNKTIQNARFSSISFLNIPSSFPCLIRFVII